MIVALDQRYNIGEKQTVILYIYIIRHAATLEQKRQKQTRKLNLDTIQIHWVWDWMGVNTFILSYCMYLCMVITYISKKGSTG